jgi:hypothetical protein
MQINVESDVATWYGYLCPQTPPSDLYINNEMKVPLDNTLSNTIWGKLRLTLYIQCCHNAFNFNCIFRENDESLNILSRKKYGTTHFSEISHLKVVCVCEYIS